MTPSTFNVDRIRALAESLDPVLDQLASGGDPDRSIEAARDYLEEVLQLKPQILEALDAVLAEIKRQDAKWGDQSENGLFKWHAILSEEVGEVAQACLEHSRLGDTTIRAELTQVAAVAVQWWAARRRREQAAADAGADVCTTA